MRIIPTACTRQRGSRAFKYQADSNFVDAATAMDWQRGAGCLSRKAGGNSCHFPSSSQLLHHPVPTSHCMVAPLGKGLMVAQWVSQPPLVLGRMPKLWYAVIDSNLCWSARKEGMLALPVLS